MHINKKTEEKRETNTWTEDLEEQKHLENTLGSQPYVWIKHIFRLWAMAKND